MCSVFKLDKAVSMDSRTLSMVLWATLSSFSEDEAETSMSKLCKKKKIITSKFFVITVLNNWCTVLPQVLCHV